MKTIATLSLALVLLFALCGNVCSADTEVGLRAKISELQVKNAYLEGQWMQIYNSAQDVIQDAKPIYAKADAILKAKKDNFTCEEKVILLTAALYEQTLQKLACMAKLIEVQMMIIQEEIARLGHRLQALKKGVSA